MGMEPTPLDRLGYLLCTPYTLPSWILVGVAAWHAFVSGRRGLALQLVYAAWFAALILDLVALQHLLEALVTPSGCGGFWSARDTLMDIHLPHVVLAVVTQPLTLLSRRTFGYRLRHGGAWVAFAFVQITLLAHLALLWITTPFGSLPTLSMYFRMLGLKS